MTMDDVRSGEASAPSDQTVPEVPEQAGEASLVGHDGLRAWAARLATARQQRLGDAPALNRVGRLEQRREEEYELRTQAAIDACATAATATGLTAVVAHHHDWFVKGLRVTFQSCGIDVVAATPNAADALGTAIFHRPALLVIGPRLEMRTAQELVAEARTFCPATWIVAQGGAPDEAALRTAGADDLYPHPLTPQALTEWLLEALAARPEPTHHSEPGEQM
jgi:hypothetical protein